MCSGCSGGVPVAHVQTRRTAVTVWSRFGPRCARFCQRQRDPLGRLLLGAVALFGPRPLAIAAVVLVLRMLPVLVLVLVLLLVLALLFCGLRTAGKHEFDSLCRKLLLYEVQDTYE